MSNKVKPTLLQKRTLEILKENPKLPIGKAMIEAGYSKKSAVAPKENFLDRKGTAVGIEQWRTRLRGIGITEDLLVKKHLEWLFAEKKVTSPTGPDEMLPDYPTQLKAGEMLRKDFGLSVDEPIQQTNIQVNLTRGENERV
jgi:hypothetical protein